jgi:hypothetical protein
MLRRWRLPMIATYVPGHTIGTPVPLHLVHEPDTLRYFVVAQHNSKVAKRLVKIVKKPKRIKKEVNYDVDHSQPVRFNAITLLRLLNKTLICVQTKWKGLL